MKISIKKLVLKIDFAQDFSSLCECLSSINHIKRNQLYNFVFKKNDLAME